MARQFQWLSADGQLTALTDRVAGYRVMADGTTGLNAPPYRFTTSQHAGRDGVAVDAVTAGPREITLGMLVQAADEADLLRRTASLTRAMRPKAGPGQLIVTADDGTVRSLTCYYTAGLEGSEARGTKLPGRWWKFALQLTAFTDPWFYGETRTVSLGLGAPSTFFPIFPLVLSPSTVQGEFTVDLSDADDKAWPVWTVHGPGSGLILTNETTGRVLEVTASLLLGESMTIDTRPTVRSIRRENGTNLLGSTDGEPQLWPLVETVNEVTAALSGASDDSRIIGEYQPRYAGA